MLKVYHYSRSQKIYKIRLILQIITTSNKLILNILVLLVSVLIKRLQIFNTSFIFICLKFLRCYKSIKSGAYLNKHRTRNQMANLFQENIQYDVIIQYGGNQL